MFLSASDLTYPNGWHFSYFNYAAVHVGYRQRHGFLALFLNHTVLWQPFGIGERHADRGDGDVIVSSLPSWSITRLLAPYSLVHGS